MQKWRLPGVEEIRVEVGRQVFEADSEEARDWEGVVRVAGETTWVAVCV